MYIHITYDIVLGMLYSLCINKYDKYSEKVMMGAMMLGGIVVNNALKMRV